MFTFITSHCHDLSGIENRENWVKLSPGQYLHLQAFCRHEEFGNLMSLASL